MSDPSAKFELSRRSFLGLSLAAAGGLLFGCSPGDGPGAVPGESEDNPFDVWEKLRTAVRASPDHLAAAADRVVAGKDPAAILAFVRDQIATYPPTGLDAAVTEMRWGVRGALRGGAGTPREKAELLASLYRRAGFDAQVVFGSVPSADRGTAAKRAYLRPPSRQFAPSVDKQTLAEWQTRMARAGRLGVAVPVDPHSVERFSLSEFLSGVLPADVAAKMGPYDATLDTAAIDTMPLVAVTVDGAVRFANPLFPDARFGDSLTDEAPAPAPAADPTPTVVVELSVATTAAPTRRIPVARASYAADQLAGRQLLAQFAPATDIDTLARLRIADIRTFKPVLSLRGPDVDPDADPSFVVVGSEVTLRGDIVDTAADGTIVVNGRPLFAPSAVDPAAAGRVASVAANVRAGAFPTIRVDVTALDAAGRAVGGLAASAFQVLEDGAPMGLILGATPADKVRVFLDFDLDEPLATGEDPLELARQLTRAIVAAYPGATIVTGTDGAYVEETDPDAVAAAVAGDDSDDTWADLASAAGAAPTITVVVSDFEGLTDPADPGSPKGAYRALVAAGPPVVAIATDASPGAEVARLAALTGGVAVPGGGIRDSVAVVLDVLATRAAGGGGYTLTYTAPIDGQDRREVKVSAGQQAAAASYPVPPADGRVEQKALAGVYLTVSLGDATVSRVLGGYRSNVPPDFGVPVAREAIDDVQNALFGVSLLSFEAAAPSLATALDDLLSMKLAIRPLWEAVDARDSDAIRANLGTLRTYVPAELTMLQCAPSSPTEDWLTYEDGLRIVHYSHRPRFGVGHERRVDILPVSGWGTISATARGSFLANLADTARIAVVEGHALATSMLLTLPGSSVKLLPLGDIDATALPYPAGVAAAAAETLNQFATSYRLLPDVRAFVGFWAVSTQTGALLGVLADGSGGATESDECKSLGALNNAFTALGLLAGLAGMAGLGPYFWLGKQTASVALLSAAILDNQEVGNPDPDAPLEGLAASAACEAAKLAFVTGATASGTPAGDSIGDADTANSVGSLAGAGVTCPNALAGVGCT